MIGRVALALLLLAPVAGAQEPARHDLRARHTAQVGDEVQVVERERMRQRFRLERDGQVLEEGKEATGTEQRYLRRVEAVADGVITGEWRRYELVKHLGEPEQEERYEPAIELRVALREDRRSYARVGDAAQPLPRLLHAAIERETAGKVERKREDAPYLALFPERPVAVGEEWVVAPARLAKVLTLDPRHVGSAASSARARLKAVDASAGRRFYEVELSFSLALTHVLEQPVQSPGTLSGKLELGLSPDGPRRYARVQAVMEYQGPCPGQDVPPGSQLKLRLELENTDERTPPPPRPAGPAPPGRG
ncbi:MAG: hypothetical protein AB7N76_04805 [Planctomycetota bacterium]